MSTEEEELRRLNALDQCLQHTSSVTVAALEDLKKKLTFTRSLLAQTSQPSSSSSSVRIEDVQRELADTVTSSKRVNDDISSALKIYHAHISKMNKSIDRAIETATEEKFQNFTSLLPSVDCKLSTFGKH